MKNRKLKIVGFSIVLILLIQTICVLTSYASDGCVIKLSDGEASSLEEVTLAVNISGNTGIAGLELWLSYDKNLLTPISLTLNDAFGGRLDSNMKESGALLEELDKISIVWTTTKGNKIDGDLCYITFSVNGNTEKYIPVTMIKKHEEDIFDNDFNNIAAELLSGKITVTDAQAADKSDLEDKIDEARLYLEDEQYTSESLSKLNGVIYEAELLYYSDNAGKEELDDMIAALDTAIGELCVKTFYVFVENAGNTNLREGYEFFRYAHDAWYEIVCDEGYEIVSVLLDGEEAELSGNMLEIGPMQSNRTISVVTKRIEYPIEVLEVENGVIEINTPVVKHGDSLSIRVFEDGGYIVSALMIDDVDIGAYSEYEIKNVTKSYTIGAVLEEENIPMVVSATARTGGSISPKESIVNYGCPAVFMVKPQYGYEARYVICNNNIFPVENDIVIIEAVTENMQIEAVFDKKEYNIVIEAAIGGSGIIKYDGFEGSSMNVLYKDAVDIEIVPDGGYELKSVFVNSVAVKADKLKGGKFGCSINVTGNTVIKVTFVKDMISSYREKVELNGVPGDVNRDNARAKKLVFTKLAEEYLKLTDEEKSVVSQSYGCVLAVLDRANAYIMLEESRIEALIDNLPAPEAVTEESIAFYETDILNARNSYEKLTTLAKSFVSYQRQKKLDAITEAFDAVKQREDAKADYFYGIVEGIPSEITLENAPGVYAKLKNAEDIANSVNVGVVSDESIGKMKDALNHALAVIYDGYIKPFEEKVLSLNPVLPEESWESAEWKKAAIFSVMSEYDGFEGYVKKLIHKEISDRLNVLYQSACVTVTREIDGEEIQAVGDIDVEQTLVISKSEDDVTDVVGDEMIDKLLDIKLLENDAEVQPKGKIMIKVPIDDLVAESNPSVMYIDENGNVFDMQATVVDKNGTKYLLWATDHFSSFAIVFEAKKGIVFDKTPFPTAGESITATVNGIDMNGRTLWCAVYGSDKNLESGVKGEENTATVTITENSRKIKAMVWDGLTPIEYAEMIK